MTDQEQHEWTSFVFAFGQVCGYLTREATRDYFTDRDISKVDVGEFRRLAYELAKAFYREP